jgi:hypothetical protein
VDTHREYRWSQTVLTSESPPGRSAIVILYVELTLVDNFDTSTSIAMSHPDQHIEYDMWQEAREMMELVEDPELIPAKYTGHGSCDGTAVVKVSTVTPVKKCEGKRRKIGLGSVSKALLFTKQNKDSSQSLQSDQARVESIRRFDSALRAQLVAWTDKLIELQPKVYMSAHIMECALCLFKALRQRQLKSWVDGRLPKSYISNRELMRHDLVAVWWIAMKHCSIRTLVPNRALLSRATESKRVLLSDCELSALCALEWDVNRVLRAHGLVLCSSDADFEQ